MKTRHLEADQWLNRKEWCLGSGRRRQLSQDRKEDRRPILSYPKIMTTPLESPCIKQSIHEDDKHNRLEVHESVHRDIIVKVTNKMQLYRLIYYS